MAYRGVRGWVGFDSPRLNVKQGVEVGGGQGRLLRCNLPVAFLPQTVTKELVDKPPLPSISSTTTLVDGACRAHQLHGSRARRDERAVGRRAGHRRPSPQ